MADITASTALPNTNWTFTRGDDLFFPFQLSVGANPLPLSKCDTITFSVKTSLKDTGYIVQKTNAVNGGITTVDDATGKGVVKIPSSDSPDQTRATVTYYYDLEVVIKSDAGFGIVDGGKFTLMQGTLTLTDDVTK